MDLTRKAEMVRAAIDSISHHEDEDASVRQAVLAAVVAHAQAESAAIAQRVQQRIADLQVPST